MLAAVTRGSIEIRGVRPLDLEPVTAVAPRMKVSCQMSGDCLTVHESRPEAIRPLTTGLWPGFPSDMVGLVTVLCRQADEAHADSSTWIHQLPSASARTASAGHARRSSSSAIPTASSSPKSTKTARPQPRQPRPPLRHGPHRRARWPPTARASSHRWNTSSAATPTSSSRLVSLGAQVAVAGE